MEVLKYYKAKLDGTTIFRHNKDLTIIAKQVESIFDLKQDMIMSLYICIDYHDVGKVVKSFQNNIDSKRRTVRHEILSASIKELRDRERISIITTHKELHSLIKFIENEFYEDEVKEMSLILNAEIIDIRPFIKRINLIEDELVTSLDNILLKGYLQYCDHLASAGVKEIEIGFCALDVFKFNTYNSIQKKVFELNKKEDIMIIAPTGLGKTSTSLFWSDLIQNSHRSKRIYYLLPFTASINALYKDMVSKNISTAMMHNKAEYFLDKIDSKQDIKQLYNLFKKSVKQLNISTIYQIVKAIFGCTRYEMILAQLKNSIFIVDEIHCFDIEQIALLLTTLKFLKSQFGISICIMSASIPTVLQELISSELKIHQIINASEKDFKKRHRIHRIKKSILDDLDKIRKDLDSGKKVIVCVNTVGLSQKLYTELNQYNPTLIHGKFNARDREKSEENIKDSNLLIGTQAIEVSLDIDYDRLYTEIAPFDSLLQRFGRVNRYALKSLCDIYIYNLNDNSRKIYLDDIIQKTDTVIEKILKEDNGLVLEYKIQNYLDGVYSSIDISKYNEKSSSINDLIKSLKLATYNKSIDENMFSDSTVSILPEILLDEYNQLIREKKYLEANALFVNVKYTNYIKNSIRKMDGIYVTNLVYDQRGLVY